MTRVAEATSRVEAALGRAAARELCLTLLDGRVSRIGVARYELDRIERLFRDLDLFVARSPEFHVPKRDIGKGGYCNRFAERFDADHPQAHALLYVGQDVDLVRRSRDAEADEDDAALGSSLRYPPCCVAWYEAAWLIALERHQGDLFPLSHAATPAYQSGRSLLNFSANYFSGGWLSFFPCSLACSAAHDSVARERALVAGYAPALAAYLDEETACAVVYTEFKGIAQVRSFEVDASRAALQYDRTALTLTLRRPTSRLARALLQGDTLVSTGTFGFDVEQRGRTIHSESGARAFVRWFDVH